MKKFFILINISFIIILNSNFLPIDPLCELLSTLNYSHNVPREGVVFLITNYFFSKFFYLELYYD